MKPRGGGLDMSLLSGYSCMGVLAVVADWGNRQLSFGGGVGGIVVPVEYRDRDEMVGAPRKLGRSLSRRSERRSVDRRGAKLD